MKVLVTFQCVLYGRVRQQLVSCTTQNPLGHLCHLGHDPEGVFGMASSAIRLNKSMTEWLLSIEVDQDQQSFINEWCGIPQAHGTHLHGDSAGSGVYPTSILR